MHFKKKKIVILGSTGSIGRQALEVINLYPEKFEVVGISAKKNIEILKQQIEKFNPEIVGVEDEERGKRLEKILKNKKVKILKGENSSEIVASYEKANFVIVAIVGSEGILPTLKAIQTKKEIALANKETLVSAGEIVMKLARKYNVKILPVDSEHSAIFQCLLGEKKEFIEKLILTSSGGPFLKLPKNKFKNVTVEDALKHPTWKMGKKITIDSATLMNKGLEIIEAYHLFSLSVDKISVVIHPESIVHSMVLFKDGSIKAQLGLPDMRLPIFFALSYPERFFLPFERLDFKNLKLNFTLPDEEKFPTISFAKKAIKIGGSMPAVLNAANEVAVNLFLEKKITFLEIFAIIENEMKNHKVIYNPGIEEILKIDKKIKERVRKCY
jgi:1-deoxy-D-xylulose-5-phosphate reductoisomerase